ncbi:hypothetical protein AB0C07_15720 [Actinoplanes missouriensis]|uniref:hypothetical protein n=1 Tax=Actinoplanes missouriensis TaxID=1866 RepID=UPI0033F3E48D
MSRRRLLSMLVTALLAVTGTVLINPAPAAAAAWEYNDAVASSAPTGDFECHSVTGVTACYKPYGDVFYVKDTAADSASATAMWYMNYNRDWNYWDRQGECRNKLGNGKWGACNKDLDEEAFVKMTGRVVDFSPEPDEVIRYTGWYWVQ